MATLADTLRAQRRPQEPQKQVVRGAGGVLTEQSTEEVQSLAGQLGLPSTPTTPLGTAMIGGNEHQQKMAGTPAQLKASLSLASKPPEQSLSGALRRQQVRSDASEYEQKTIEKSQDMENLGNLGQRVTSFIDAQREKLAQATVQPDDVQAAGTITNAQGQAVTHDEHDRLGHVKNILTYLRRDPSNQDWMRQLNIWLGYDLNRQISAEEINKMYEDTVTTIARGGAGNVDNDLTVNDLLQVQDFGYDLATLEQLLGVPQADLQNYNVGQLRAAIDKVATDEFSNVQQLEQQAASGQLGIAERGLARQATREASRVGTRSSEADVVAIEQQIANADEVRFGGRVFKVDELLKDETVTKLISDYLGSAPDSDIRQQIDQFEPELRDFISKNQNILTDAAAALGGTAKEFQSIQTFNKDLQTSAFNGVKLDDKLAEAIIPGWGQLNNERVNVDSVPLLAHARAVGPQGAATLANNLNTELKSDPSVGQEIASLSAGDLASWQIESDNPESNWKKYYVEPKRFFEKIQKTTPDQNDHLVSYIYKDARGTTDIQHRMNIDKANNTLGFPSGLNTQLVDRDGDGRIDSGSVLKDTLLAANPRPSLSKGPSGQTVYRPGKLGHPGIPSDPVDKGIWEKLTGVAASGSVNPAELRSVNLSLDELIRLQDLNGKGVDRAGLDQVYSEKRNEESSKTVEKIRNSTGDLAQQKAQLRQELENRGSRRLNPTVIYNAITEIERAERQLQSERQDREGQRRDDSEAGKVAEGINKTVDSFQQMGEGVKDGARKIGKRVGIK